MQDWTTDMVEDRLKEAASVMRKLPAPRILGYFNTWPSMMVEFSDLVGQTPERMRLPPPSAAAISRMETAMTWLSWLEPEDVKFVWARAEGARWKEICWKFGIARSTASLRWAYCLNLITWRLNRRPLSSRWSRRYLLERAKILSSNF